jgi:hypothetical protein
MATAPDDAVTGDFDYASPEGQRAVDLALGLVLEIREELQRDPMERKIALYERSLGLAVVPVLTRRALRRLLKALATRSGLRG